MNEEEAREVVRSMVDPQGFDRLERMVVLVLRENERQNLIARSTIDEIWVRHVLDSIQLLKWRPPVGGLWLDVGTGGGFPGLAIAAAIDGETLLVEPRKLRAAFLADAIDVLGLKHTSAAVAKVEAVTATASVISARAVAPIEKLLQATAHCATASTQWLLPRGRISKEEQTAWAARSEMMFHVEHSLTDPASCIVIGWQRAA